MRTPLRWLLGSATVAIVGLAAIFIWGYLQPKPDGFAPTDPDQGAVIADDWTLYTVDATDRDQWVFFDFSQGRTVGTSVDASDWDLAFKRTDLIAGSDATDSGISDWYDYSFMTHTVHAKADSYLVRGSDSDFLIRFDSYYCEDEAAGCITFRYQAIPQTRAS
jgi:hypothetical protein